MQSNWNQRVPGGRFAGAASSQYTFVFFDLETTSLDISQCHIFQLSAVCGERTFNKYVLPGHSITSGASRVTGFTVEGGRLLKHGHPMQTVPLRQALIDFLTFLRGLQRPVLVAHNALDFDAPILLRILRRFFQYNQLTRIIVVLRCLRRCLGAVIKHLCSRHLELRFVTKSGTVGFLDTLRLSRDLPVCSGLRKFSLEFLVDWFLGKSYEAHNALEDSKVLQELFYVWSPSPTLLDKHLYSIDQVEF